MAIQTDARQPKAAPDAPKPKAYSYIRFSTPDQLKGDSLRRQLSKTRLYANKHGLDLVDRFDDLGVSAFRGNNAEFGALAQFNKLVQGGEIDRGSYLIVESMDRLSRQKVMDAFVQLAAIVRSGIILVTLDDEQVYSDKSLEFEPFKLFIALGAMARAHDESKRKSGLLSDSWIGKRERLQSKGTILTSQVPAWLKADRAKNEIRPIPERVELVERIFTMTRDGYGTYSIARHLNQSGIKPWGARKNAVWRESYIKKILVNRAVLGEFQAHRIEIDGKFRRKRIAEGEVIPNYYPAVVSQQLYQEALQATARRRRTGAGRKGKGFANLFTGLLRCRCTEGMRYVDKGPPPKGGQYLRCSVALAGGACKAGGFRYALVESAILHAIGNLDIGKVLGGASRPQRLSAKEFELSIHQHELESVQKKISKFLNAIASLDDGSAPSLALAVSKLEKEKADLSTKIETVECEIAELNSIDPESRKRVINELLERIRSEDDPATAEKTRRALASELQRLIEKITVQASDLRASEEIENYPDWKTRHGVNSEQELESHLKHHDFTLKIIYANGDAQVVEGATGRPLTFKMGLEMKRLKLNAEIKIGEDQANEVIAKLKEEAATNMM